MLRIFERTGSKHVQKVMLSAQVGKLRRVFKFRFIATLARMDLTAKNAMGLISAREPYHRIS